MDRHSLIEAPRHSQDDTSLDDAPTQFIPKGHDGASVPTEIIPVATQNERVSANDILYEHVSPSQHAGLGRYAVKMHLGHVETGNDAYDDERREYLGAIRSYLESMSPERRENASKLLDTPPKWLEDAINFNQNEHGAGTSILDKLVTRVVTKDTPDGKYAVKLAVSDDTLQSFLDWHNHGLAKKQEALDERENALKAMYAEKFQQAAKDGWILPYTLHHLDRLKFTRIIVDDGFATSLHGIRAHARSSDMDRWHEINVSPLRIDHPEKDLLHEFTHLMDGRDPGKEGIRELSSNGLLRIFGDGIGGTAADEALVEHFARSLDKGEIDQTDPDSEIRRDDAHIYYAERKFLHALCTEGVEPINIRTLLHANFEDTLTAQEFGKESAQQKLIEALAAAFPFTDVVAEIRELGEGDSIEEYTQSLVERTKKYVQERPGMKVMSIIRQKSHDAQLERQS